MPPRRAALSLVPAPDPEPGWSVIEQGFTLAREHEIESLLAISNGYLGIRGSLAEGTPLSSPATFVAGVFERAEAQAVPGLYVLPDWTAVRARVGGRVLSLQEGQTLEHRRVLDLRRGMLWREWRHRSRDGRVTRLLGFRLASLADRHLVVQSVVFTPENYTGELRLETAIAAPESALASASHGSNGGDGAGGVMLSIALRAPGTDVTVALATASRAATDGYEAARRELEIAEGRLLEWREIPVEIGAELRLDRLVSIYTSRERKDPVAAAVGHLAEIDDVRAAVGAHISAWRSRWEAADVQVDGDDALQRALRFALYHLISAANPEDEGVSIGARALTGGSYKGHVFWDTETYMLPFYTFTHPPSARALLMYRYRTLPAAREKARAAGYRGAMYPWESADTGEETTPRFVIDPQGRVVPVHNGEIEIHISADVAYAVWQYWRVSGDDDFLARAGAEILLEAARFWASRGRMEADGAYHIRHVIGPDEYHEDVDDSAFTNLMAAWNLETGAEAARLLAGRWPERWHELSQRLQLTTAEADDWRRIARSVYTGFDPRTGVFEQFRGYFEKEPLDLRSYEPRSAAMDVILGHERIQATNVVKQADVVMALYLLSERFPADVREANFRYYEPRTGHGSSLSPSIHALVAARLDQLELAAQYLQQAAEIDLGNNMGNAAGGVHAAAIGGLWQAVVFGFAGVRLEAEGLCFDPHLLPRWRRLAFPLELRGTRLRVAVEHERLAVAVAGGSQPVRLSLASGAGVLAEPRHEYAAERAAGGWQPWRDGAS